eukprot:1464393-Amphidinium_carterae.1
MLLVLIGIALLVVSTTLVIAPLALPASETRAMPNSTRPVDRFPKLEDRFQRLDRLQSQATHRTRLDRAHSTLRKQIRAAHLQKAAGFNAEGSAGKVGCGGRAHLREMRQADTSHRGSHRASSGSQRSLGDRFLQARKSSTGGVAYPQALVLESVPDSVGTGSQEAKALVERFEQENSSSMQRPRYPSPAIAPESGVLADLHAGAPWRERDNAAPDEDGTSMHHDNEEQANDDWSVGEEDVDDRKVTTSSARTKKLLQYD